MAASSPASSPRLPSPPPIAEDQIGPTSPGVSLFEEDGKFPGVNNIDTGASRRIRRGTKAEDMAEGPPLVELHDIDSAFPLTEHLKALHYSHTHPPSTHSTLPLTADMAKQLSIPPPGTSKDIWLYELGRLLIQKTNGIIVALFADSPPCSPQTCPEMRASEWQYLCAVHDPPKSCAAIDYCCHTLDWAATTLTSSKMFPSRLGLGSGSGMSNSGPGGDKVLQQQMKEIKNIFRRVYRIFAHAWFQHREMFWRVEGRTGLYVFFKTVCDEYGIIEAENYTIPAEAEGGEPASTSSSESGFGSGESEEEIQAPSLLRRDPDATGVRASSNGSPEKSGQESLGMNDTTKRHHKHTMSENLSTSADAVIKEEAEPEEEDQSQEIAAPAPDKPNIARQATALKDMVEESPTAVDTAEEEDDAVPDDEPVPGIARSDTLKPTTSDGEAADREDGDQTTVEITSHDRPTGKDKAEDEEVKVEVKEVQDQSAAEGEDAGTSVGD